MEKTNAILIDENDDVATTLKPLNIDEFGVYCRGEKVIKIKIGEPIPCYHKFSVRDIPRNQTVRKYGEVIGEALADIPQGFHVHEHNLASVNRE